MMQHLSLADLYRDALKPFKMEANTHHCQVSCIRVSHTHTHTPRSSLPIETYALPTVHREGDVAEDGASRLCVLHRQAPHVHLAAVGPAVVGVRVVDDEVRSSFPARLPRPRLLRRQVDELEHPIHRTHLRRGRDRVTGRLSLEWITNYYSEQGVLRCDKPCQLHSLQCVGNNQGMGTKCFEESCADFKKHQWLLMLQQFTLFFAKTSEYQRGEAIEQKSTVATQNDGETFWHYDVCRSWFCFWLNVTKNDFLSIHFILHHHTGA